MDQSNTIYSVLLIISLVMSAFFSGSESAFLSLRKVRLRRLVDEGTAGAERVIRMADQPEKVLPTVLLANNLANTGFAALATVIMVGIVGEGRGVILATIASTIILLIFGETIPKTIALRHSERVFFFSSKVIEILEKLILPLILILQWTSNRITRRFGSESVALFTEEEIKAAISMGQEAGEVEEDEAELLQKVFRFGDMQLREMMTPRTEVVWVETGTTLGQFLEIYGSYSHTRFPVFHEQVDNVIGVLSVKDVLASITTSNLYSNGDITDLLRPVYFVPDTKPVGSLFREMQSKGGQMAMAVDEFGGIAGLVTIKQLMEELVGPVGEEERQPEPEYEILSENTFNIEGVMQIDQVNQELGLNLPEGDYETIAGFILEYLGHIPGQGEQFWHQDIGLTVTEVKGVKIEKVMIVTESFAPQSENN